MTTKSTDNSPEFSPSILQNQRGPLRPSVTSQPSNPLKPILPAQVNRLLDDKRAVALVCLFLPPLAVLLKAGVGRKFGLSLLLFAFFIFPGKHTHKKSSFMTMEITFLYFYRNYLRFLCKFFRIVLESK